WRVVTGIDGRRRVSALIRVLDGGEFTVCKILRSLVQAGLVEIEPADGAAPGAGDGPSTAAAALPTPDADAAQSRPAPKAARAQTAVLDAEPAPVADDADPLADGLDRGAVVAL